MEVPDWQQRAEDAEAETRAATVQCDELRYRAEYTESMFQMSEAPLSELQREFYQQKMDLAILENHHRWSCLEVEVLANTNTELLAQEDF